MAHQNPARRLACALAALLASACSGGPTGPVSDLARPQAAPQPAVTRFEDALQCMDTLFVDYGVSGVSIAVSGVPDYTGRAYVGSDIWLQTAIGKMSQRSRAFVVTDFNPNPNAPEQSLWSMLRDNQRFYVPAYYIRGAISGFADSVASQSTTAAIGAVAADAGLGGARNASLVSVDLTVGDLQQRTLIGRAHAGNEVTLQQTASGAQLGGRVAKFGGNLEFTVSRSEGVPQAVRALVELGAIEVLGRLTGAPYWTCLGANIDAPDVVRARQDIFANMSAPERVVFVQRRLTRLGLYAGPLNGQPTPELTAAAARYAQTQGAAPVAVDSFAMYELLAKWSRDGSSTAVTAAPAPAAVVAELPTAGLARPPSQALQIQVVLAATSHAPGAPVSVMLRSNKTAFAYCYLQDRTGAVARVFPNRWQPDPLLRPQQSIAVPSPQAGFQLVLPPAGAEQVNCFASSQDVSQSLPANLRGQDLEPLPTPSLNALSQVFQSEVRRRAAEFAKAEATLSPK